LRLETASMGRMELHDLIGNALGPRPMSLISTVGPDGTYNAAPYSFVTPVCSKPAIICVSIGLRHGEKKDTLKNIEHSHDFVINSVDETILKQAVQASADYPYGVDEIKETGLTAVKSECVSSPYIAEAVVSLECQLYQKIEILEEYKDGPGLRAIVFGEVVLAHVADELWVDGSLDPTRLRLVGRVGTDFYSKPGEVFKMKHSGIHG
jgi:flavin reductase (DIM6/NTAB) family NADH-FMN oxidoreductase RutF